MLTIFLPVLLIPLIVVLPIILVELLHRLEQSVVLVAFAGIPHNHHFLPTIEVYLRHLSVVEEDVAEVTTVRERSLLLEPNEVFSEMVALEEDGRVVFEVEVEEGNHLGIAVALQVG